LNNKFTGRNLLQNISEWSEYKE